MFIPVVDKDQHPLMPTKLGKARKWNRSFSPLEVGKKWFYSELSKLGKIHLLQGYETAKLRNELGLKKSKNKLEENFNTHCVDGWVLAYSITHGLKVPDNTNIMCIHPIRLHRRQLHMFQPAKGGARKTYGGTRSVGFKRGSIIKHPKYGITYVGGTSKNKISLHDLKTGKRLTQHADASKCKFLTYSTSRYYFTPA